MRTKSSTTSLHAGGNPQNHIHFNPLSHSASPPPLSQSITADLKSVQQQDASREPKIFPGIVHERTRRNSVRQGSVSEGDMEASTGNLRAMMGLSLREEVGESDGEGV